MIIGFEFKLGVSFSQFNFETCYLNESVEIWLEGSICVAAFL
jgi:hypothetical protein